MHAHPTTGDAVRTHSAVSLFRALRSVITYKKLAGQHGKLVVCTNRELYSHLHPSMSHFFVTHELSMESVLRDWCFNNRVNLARLGLEEGIGMVVPGYILNARSIMARGDNWELTEDALLLITNLRTNEAIDEHVACALRGLEQDI
jgi:hypothetical protein